MSKGRKLFITGCGLLVILSSCKDNPGNLGPQVLPKSDLIYAYQSDTTTIVTSMYLKDSTLTNDAATSLLGSYNDPVFGLTKASIYAQVFPANSPTIPWYNSNNVTVDSAVMELMLSGTTFGGNDPQTYAIYPLANNIVSGQAYYSNATIKFSSNTPIGEAQVTSPPLTTTNDTIRIRLTQAFTGNFTQELLLGQILKSNNLPSNWSTTFDTVLRGVCITTLNPLQLPGQGSLVSVNLNDAASGIYVYWHNKRSIPDTESSTYFPVGGGNYGQYFCNFTHNYSTSAIGATHPSGPRDSVSAQQLIYIQATAGILGRINFPYIKNWSKQSPIVINEALLTLPIDEQYVTGTNIPPSQMYVVGTGSNWIGYALPDEGQPYYGGVPINNGNNSSYTFGITQYIQSIIDGKNDSDRGLYIIPGNTSTLGNGVVLYGAGHGKALANKATLTIYYTPLKKS